MAKLKNLDPTDFTMVLQDLELAPESLQVVDPAPPPPSEGKAPPRLEQGSLLVGQIGTGLDIPAAAALYRRRGDGALPPDGWALFFLKDARSDAELARWRNHLWPWLHVLAVYRIQGGVVERETLQGRQTLAGACTKDGVLVVARRREHVMSPQVTIAKFDKNAAGWNGVPGQPGYAHHRWMRRYVGHFAKPERGARVLDFGCGAGWVGIEAASSAPDVALRFFDPSSEMVKHAAENAHASGIADARGSTGFGEAPPYPNAQDGPFDIVYSSGVISFAPDPERWLDGLCATVRPGGTLVIGDIQAKSAGMLRRRATKPILPTREMNAHTDDDVRARLERRGFRFEAGAGYQLTRPVPQLTHWSDVHLGGVLSPVCLGLNRMLAGRLGPARFDSWVMRLRAPG